MRAHLKTVDRRPAGTPSADLPDPFPTPANEGKDLDVVKVLIISSTDHTSVGARRIAFSIRSFPRYGKRDDEAELEAMRRGIT